MDAFTSKKCSVHNKPVVYIDIYSSANNPFSCYKCTRNKDYLKEIILISEVLEDDDLDFLSNFPPLEESIQKRMINVSNLSNDHEGILRKIDKYFEDIQSQIETDISTAKNQAKGKANRLLRSNEQIFTKYNSVSLRKELRQILREGGDQMESKVTQILTQVTKQENIAINSKAIGESLDESETWRKSINFTIPNKIKENVLNLISKIDFFSGVTVQDFEEMEKQNYLFKNGQVNENSNSSNCKLLMDLISSKTNFCQEDFLNKTKEMIEGLSFFINSYQLGENQFNVENRNAFQRLNENQMNQIVELSKKISEISEAYANQNIPNEEINSIIQPSTSNLLKYPSEVLQQNEEASKLLLKQYPIFEFLKIHNFSFLSSVNLIKSPLTNSKQFIITKEINRHLVAQNNQDGHCICYCNFILNQTKQYIIRIQLSQNNNNGSNNNHLAFGLITDSEKDSNYLHSRNLIYFERDSNNRINKIIRGGQVAKGSEQPVNRDLEVRICLEKKILRVSDYPNYNDVCEINDPNNIKSDIPYRLAMESYCAGSKIAIKEIIEVNFFDDKM